MDLIDGGNASIIQITQLVDDAKCFETARKFRWPNGVLCPHCLDTNVIKYGHDNTQIHRQRYYCKNCSRSFMI